MQWSSSSLIKQNQDVTQHNQVVKRMDYTFLSKMNGLIILSTHLFCVVLFLLSLGQWEVMFN